MWQRRARDRRRLVLLPVLLLMTSLSDVARTSGASAMSPMAVDGDHRRWSDDDVGGRSMTGRVSTSSTCLTPLLRSAVDLLWTCCATSCPTCCETCCWFTICRGFVVQLVAQHVVQGMHNKSKLMESRHYRRLTWVVVR